MSILSCFCAPYRTFGQESRQIPTLSIAFYTTASYSLDSALQAGLLLSWHSSCAWYQVLSSEGLHFCWQSSTDL